MHYILKKAFAMITYCDNRYYLLEAFETSKNLYKGLFSDADGSKIANCAQERLIWFFETCWEQP